MGQYLMGGKEYRKQYYVDNKERIDKYNRIWAKNNPLKHNFGAYKTNAKAKGLIFAITLNEFMEIVEKPCYYCGGEGYGIDRLDNSMGYLKGNIVSCCSMCNYMKNAYTEEDFISQCIKIAKRWVVV